MNALVTVYGPARDMHSGNYGNWAPNPALALARLAGVDERRCRARDDRRLLRRRDAADGGGAQGDRRDPRRGAGADEGVRLRAARESPDRLELRHNLPTLNINAMEAGGGVGGQGRTIIPASAQARLDLRFVKGVDPTKQFDRLVAHVTQAGLLHRRQGAGRRRRGRRIRCIAQRDADGRVSGRAARRWTRRLRARSARRVSDAAGGTIVRLPTIGGSAPFYLFSDVLKVPTIGLSIVNFDNNQHGANENVRIQNLWDGIETMAAHPDDAVSRQSSVYRSPHFSFSRKHLEVAARRRADQPQRPVRAADADLVARLQLEPRLAVEGHEHLVAIFDQRLDRGPATLPE